MAALADHMSGGSEDHDWVDLGGSPMLNWQEALGKGSHVATLLPAARKNRIVSVECKSGTFYPFALEAWLEIRSTARA